MEHELLDEFNKIKKDIVLSFTKYSLSGDEAKNRDAVLQSVLYTWFYPLRTVKDFQEKYESFVRMDKIIDNSFLFDLIELLSDGKEPDPDKVSRALLIYDSFANDKEYKKLADICGYKLPVEFGVKRYYEDGSLIEKVDFYRAFKNKLDDINGHLSSKGVVRK